MNWTKNLSRRSTLDLFSIPKSVNRVLALKDGEQYRLQIKAGDFSVTQEFTVTSGGEINTIPIRDELVRLQKDGVETLEFFYVESENNKWSRKELEATVKAYLEMKRQEAAGEKFVKKRVYENLAKKFERSEKAYERRMMNISYVYSLMGRRWVTGLKPASHVGSNIIQVIEELILKIEARPGELHATFADQVSEARKSKTKSKPKGNKKPGQKVSQSTAYERDPKVVAWLLNNAEGICEACNHEAPFMKPDGFPYLEVHHLRRLADGGSDTITNAIAACPNCHRELHYGIERDVLLVSIYGKVERLIPE